MYTDCQRPQTIVAICTHIMKNTQLEEKEKKYSSNCVHFKDFVWFNTVGGKTSEIRMQKAQTSENFYIKLTLKKESVGCTSSPQKREITYKI